MQAARKVVQFVYYVTFFFFFKGKLGEPYAYSGDLLGAKSPMAVVGRCEVSW